MLPFFPRRRQRAIPAVAGIAAMVLYPIVRGSAVAERRHRDAINLTDMPRYRFLMLCDAIGAPTLCRSGVMLIKGGVTSRLEIRLEFGL